MIKQLLVVALFWCEKPIDKNMGTRNSPPPTPTNPATMPMNNDSADSMPSCCKQRYTQCFCTHYYVQCCIKQHYTRFFFKQRCPHGCNITARHTQLTCACVDPSPFTFCGATAADTSKSMSLRNGMLASLESLG